MGHEGGDDGQTEERALEYDLIKTRTGSFGDWRNRWRGVQRGIALALMLP